MLENSLPVIAAKAPKTQFKTNSTLIFPPKKMYCPAKPIIPPPNEQHMVATVRAGPSMKSFFLHILLWQYACNIFLTFAWQLTGFDHSNLAYLFQFFVPFGLHIPIFWFYFSKSFVIQLWLWIDRLWVRIQAKPWGFLKNFLSQRKKISKNMMKEGSNSVSCQLFRRALIAHPTSPFASSAQYI